MTHLRRKCCGAISTLIIFVIFDELPFDSFFPYFAFWKDDLDTRKMLSIFWSIFIVDFCHRNSTKTLIKSDQIVRPSVSTICCTVYGGVFSGHCWSDLGCWLPRSLQPSHMNEKNVGVDHMFANKRIVDRCYLDILIRFGFTQQAYRLYSGDSLCSYLDFNIHGWLLWVLWLSTVFPSGE